MQVSRFSFHSVYVVYLWFVKFRPLIALRLSHNEQVQSQMWFDSRPPMNSTAKQLNMSFLTFGQGPYAAAVGQICKQAASTQHFSTLHCLTQLPKPVLQAHDWSKHLQFALGYGYWFWKPALAYHILHSMNDGDLLFYADAGTGIRAGSEWNNLTTPFAGPAKAHEAVRIQWNNLAPDAGTNTMALDHFIRQMAQADILAFHLPSFAERTWTKGDIFTEFGVTPDSDYGNTPQICATYFFVKKSSRTIEFMRKWVDLVTNLQLLTSAKSKTPNDKTFRSNRHDQSLFSMMLKANHPVGDLNFLVDGAGIPHFPPDPKHAVPNLKVKVQSRRGLPVVKYGNKRGWLKKRSK
eukprot:gnl/TRDRNA2_/TRDRNA2_169861_c0_seq17.p1 gnl/TRDRNA2_/TRDRNA2_169861_c0~~gnl/TRDRNA2_/TRDRNA2_169861_c0_seq17.p1  ORF type:complete len:350 (-),score=22.55 gnl/TRDRNA2_/TRDRNA2_169861_c0_seq17:49-1098(-)